MEVLQTLPPHKLVISEDFTKRGRGNVRLRDSGAKAGVKLYTIVAPEPQPVQQTVVHEEPEEVGAEEEAAAEAAMAAAAAKKKRQTMMLAAVAAVVIVIAGTAFFLFSKPKSTPAVAASLVSQPETSTPPAPLTPHTPRNIFPQP